MYPSRLSLYCRLLLSAFAEAIAVTARSRMTSASEISSLAAMPTPKTPLRIQAARLHLLIITLSSPYSILSNFMRTADGSIGSYSSSSLPCSSTVSTLSSSFPSGICITLLRPLRVPLSCALWEPPQTSEDGEPTRGDPPGREGQRQELPPLAC